MHLIPIILALIVFAAYSLLETQAVASDAATSAPAETGFFATVAPVIAQAIPADTLTIVDIPSFGCSASLMNQAKVQELLALLPAAQQAPLQTLLDTSSGVWQAQLYVGDLGMGICLPARSKLVLVPTAYVQSVKNIGIPL